VLGSFKVVDWGACIMTGPPFGYGQRPSISVVIPSAAPNSDIYRACESVFEQRLPGDVQLADVLIGHAATGAACGSLEDELRARFGRRVRVIPNPSGSTPTALNSCIVAAEGDIIARLDTHAVFEPGYLATAHRLLGGERRVDVLGGALRCDFNGSYGDAMAWALTSRWGVGGSPHHFQGHEGPSDSVYLGVFPRETFVTYGLFDEAMYRNQDDEFNYRVRARGGVVWQSPLLRSRYIRSYNARLILRQFYGYGRYKPLVIVRHPKAMRARHFIPSLALVAITLGATVSVRGRRLGLVPIAVYGAAVSGSARSPKEPGSLTRTAALVLMHAAYGAGAIVGFVPAIRVALRRKRPSPARALAPRPPCEP
jgi:succinoglycan biosynthesis protein ExoA